MKVALFTLLLGIFNLIFADYVLTYSMDYEKLNFKYKDKSNSKLHITSPDEKKALYTINDASYLVTISSNIAKVIEVQPKPKKATILHGTNISDANYKIRKYKKQKLIAGIQGHKWMVYGREGGQVYSQIIYVTNDARVVKTVRAMFSSMSKANENPKQMLNIFEIEPGYVIIQADGIKLKYFQELSLLQSEYILPKSTNPDAFFKKK